MILALKVLCKQMQNLCLLNFQKCLSTIYQIENLDYTGYKWGGVWVGGGGGGGGAGEAAHFEPSHLDPCLQFNRFGFYTLSNRICPAHTGPIKANVSLSGHWGSCE